MKFQCKPTFKDGVRQYREVSVGFFVFYIKFGIEKYDNHLISEILYLVILIKCYKLNYTYFGSTKHVNDTGGNCEINDDTCLQITLITKPLKINQIPARL